MSFGFRLMIVAMLRVIEVYAIFRIRWCFHRNDEILEFNNRLNHFEEKLEGAFWRCHRSFLVNRSRISNIWFKENFVELDNREVSVIEKGKIAVCRFRSKHL